MTNNQFSIKVLILFILTFTFCLLSFEPSVAVAPSVRIKDIAHILEARENQLMGFGLIVGLRGSGDSSQTGFTKQALTNLLSRMGVVPQGVDFKSKNVAAVIVTTNLPAFIKKGQRLDVIVSAVGDATSLQGGTLLTTPLQGVDEQVYAVAQGSLVVAQSGTSPRIPPYSKRHGNVGRIPGGALVEKEVPVSIGAQGQITIVIDQPDFTTANRVAEAIRKAGLDAVAKDAASVVLPFYEGENPVELVSKIENLSVVPDSVAKVVIDEKTGTIVMGENVRIAPVAVTFGELTIRVGAVDIFSESGEGESWEGQGNLVSARATAQVDTPKRRLIALSSGANLGELVGVLNTLGAAPKDLISILQTMRKAGAVLAEIEVI